MENEKADGRLPQQFGKFGESLVMFWMGQTLGYSVALVDHVGADIIASGENGKILAVSVKSRIFKKDDPSTVFDHGNIEKLRYFADKFECIPAVAFVFIDKGGKCIDVYLVELELFEKLCKEKKSGFSAVKEGLRINNDPKKHAMLSDENIKYLRLTTETSLLR